MDLDVGVKRWGIVGAIATATTVLLAVIGLVFRGGSDVGQIKDRQQAAVRKLDTIQSEQRNLRKRLRVLELRDAQRGVQLRSLQRDIKHLNKKFDKVEGKIDKILEIFQRYPRIYPKKE
ncbi:MAG TPA: hypothetical protein DCE42_29195 [Myxococcales bacterium]|nr:hypothetical protein [Deltaproteobacteria bacterium]MBU53480.1 hypothetical protein [Deltaproteobacteria bacterium]HAA58875.1 hypothetical protein [Myxococcales bacterium]|tara:strand:- start:6540 stop:6896 length:357 start_codon:yes stop_codon:yes gene_type:complete